LIHIIRTIASKEQVEEMLEELDPIIKLAVDVRRKLLAGGGQMHADCEAALIEDGSNQEDIWGANWIPTTQAVEFEALINIRPKQQNFSMIIQNPIIKQQVENISRQLMEFE
jgi:hypothetical protein